MCRKLSAAVIAVLFTAPLAAHHGFGRFDRSSEVELEGTVTGVDFVNPHAYLYFDVAGADGSVTPMRCEMRAATVLRRSGWSAQMFVSGAHVAIAGRPHRDDPASCYIETLTIGDAPAMERYAQLDEGETAGGGTRPLRLADGRLNISGDWAQEQYLIARAPAGGRGGGLVPKSMVAGIESGALTMDDVPNAGWGARPVTYTDAGRAASEALRALPPEASTRARCEITSILFDWVFDGPINRITQRGDVITMEYGRDLTRTIHMNLAAHPEGIEPSRAGHSIGRWEGDTLVVDTVGFAAGSLAGSVPHSDRLHVVERFTLDAATLALHRDYVAEDSVYFTDQYAGSDIVKPADAPFAVDPCQELTYVNYAEEAGEP